MGNKLEMGGEFESTPDLIYYGFCDFGTKLLSHSFNSVHIAPKKEKGKGKKKD